MSQDEDAITIGIEINTLPAEVSRHVQPLVDLTNDYVGVADHLEAARRATALVAVAVLWCKLTGAREIDIVGVAQRAFRGSESGGKT